MTYKDDYDDKELNLAGEALDEPLDEKDDDGEDGIENPEMEEKEWE